MHGQRRRLLAIAAILTLGPASIAGCGLGRSDSQQASDALNAGLQAHVAGNLDQATNSYNECLKYESTNKLCLYNLGLIAQTQQRNEEAEDYYRKSLQTDPQYAPSLYNLALVRDAAGAPDEAVSLYQQVISLQPDNAAAHYNLGLLFLRQGKDDEGTAEVTTALRLDPSLPSVSQPAPSQDSPPESPATSPSPS